jgi:hypothetical protein
MMRPVVLLFTCWACSLAQAQSLCPPVQFQGAITASGAPSSSSHVLVTRQPDGSYTAYEVTNSSPYRIIRTTPKYATTLDGCLPPRGVGPADVPSAANFGNPTGGTSQRNAFAALPSGNYLSAAISGSGLDVVEFDQNLQLVSENIYSQTLTSVLLVDLNGDGRPDLVGFNFESTSFANASLTIMLGSSGSILQAPQTYDLQGVGGSTIAAADLNGDKKIDLAVACAGEGMSRVGSGVWILPGNGDGTFQAQQLVSSSVTAAVALADLNKDGKVDLAFTSQFNGPAELTVMLNKGDGTFGAATQYTVGGTGSIAIGDVNGDGNADIVTDGVSILFGDGSGAFPSRRDYVSANASVMLFDFDGDGILDIVSGEGNPFLFSGGSNISILFGQGGGKFSGAPATGAGYATNGIAIVTADFNHDGNLDLVIADTPIGAGYITTLEGAGNGAFQVSSQSNSQRSSIAMPVDMVAGDFNRDRNDDYAVLVNAGLNQNYLLVSLGNGDGTFAAPLKINLPNGVRRLTAGDFNGDGNADLAVTLSGFDGVAPSVLILLGDGQGNFVPKNSYPSGPIPFTIVAADFNGDGKQDLAVITKERTVQLKAPT